MYRVGMLRVLILFMVVVLECEMIRFVRVNVRFMWLM